MRTGLTLDPGSLPLARVASANRSEPRRRRASTSATALTSRTKTAIVISHYPSIALGKRPTCSVGGLLKRRSAAMTVLKALW